MKIILSKGFLFLFSASFTCIIAKLSLSQASMAASTQGNHSATSVKKNFENGPASKPHLAVETKSEGTGRPTVGTDHDGIVYADFVMTPFEVKKSNERHGWTLTNARSIEHIDLLSHNDAERKRHLEENLWVTNRELVYRNETFADLVKNAQNNNEELTEVILPGIGGIEYEVKVLEVDHQVDENGVAGGSIIGHLVGDPDSEVLLGYYGQRESGGITSEKDETFISYDPREDGQIIVKQIDDEALSYAFSETTCNTIHDAHEVGEPNAEL